MEKVRTSRSGRLEGLRDMTNEALLRQEEEQQRKAVEEEARRPEYELKAQEIIDQIDDRTKREAQLARRHAPIMSIRDKTDFERPSGVHFKYHECCSEWLTGAAKLVYTFLIKEGLAPTIEWWSTEDDAGFNIIAHW